MKIKGHTTIILKDVKTGKIERHEDSNMMTNAITNYFANCGFLNYPSVDTNNMVELLLGGIMAFDDEISESVSIVHVPAGLKMIANGSVGTTNNSEVLELGSYSSTESGWQQDGSYVQTYDYTTSQANGTIACVCLTGRDYGYVGEGNSISQVAHSTKKSIINLSGSPTQITNIQRMKFNIDMTNSHCYTFAFETRTDPQSEEEYYVGVLQKYRIPVRKLNLKGTMSSPIKLSEQTIQLDSVMRDILALTDHSQEIYFEPYGNNLYLWNANTDTRNSGEWGDGWTQYLWTLTPSGNLTRQTLTNTSEDTLYGIQIPHFDGNYIFFPYVNGYYEHFNIDTTSIYILNRSNGTIQKVSNPYGRTIQNSSSIFQTEIYKTISWRRHHTSGDGRIVLQGYNPTVIDAVLGKIYPTNADSNTYGDTHATTEPLIRCDSETNNAFILRRDQGYIASINNLSSPVVKTSEKTMKIIYRITFED